MILSNYEPAEVFKFFEAISMIPRGSGNEKAVSDFIVKFAKERNLWVHQDEKYNVVIKKPGTSGYENSPAIIIQGHLDMVNEKNSDTVHDFMKDPLKLIVDGDYIKADGTTLGADNGVAVAMSMAILDRNDLKHPPLEILLTVEEEVGMGGAEFIDGSLFDGKYLLNLDMEDDESLTTSCAGGVKVRLSFKAEYMSLPAGCIGRELIVKGLKGGHSGSDIHLERANSNRVLARVLGSLTAKGDVYFSNIRGGSKENAIPREAGATIFFPEKELAQIEKIVSDTKATIKREYRISDPGLDIILEDASNAEAKVFTKALSEKLLTAALLIPNGVQAVSMELPDLTEASNNMGVIKTDEDEVVIFNAIRSSVPSRKEFIKEQILRLGALLGAKAEEQGDYPGWEYDPDSKLRVKMIDAYREVYGKEPKVEAIHAGLECGLLMKRIPGVDAISFGPKHYDVHTPDERLSISSTKRVWEFLIKVLERLK